MKHEDIETLTAERYLLDEMTEEESRAFEEHYFDCSVCADAVRNGATFIDSGKELMRVDEPVAHLPAADYGTHSAWKTWLPTAAAASFAAILSYQTFVIIPRINRERMDRAANVTSHYLSETRAGTSDNSFVLDARELTEITFAIDSDQPVSRYNWRILDNAGVSHGEGDVSVEKAKEPISVGLPSSLPAGSYSLVVEGVREDGNRLPISRISFVVRKKE